jgi:hypothetical protein
VALSSISSNVSGLNQQWALPQTLAVLGAGGVQVGNTRATPSNAPIYIQPPPPPPPRLGPAPARLPAAFNPVSGTSYDNVDGSLLQRLTAVRSFLLTLPSVANTTAAPPTSTVAPTDAVLPRTLLVI